ncbi:hypothetical protein HDR63_02410 [bacterium]|nr:hypothetical protein [bacterium]
MKIHQIFSCFCLLGAVIAASATSATAAADQKFLACGPGYVLGTHAKIDGVNAAECQKLWCVDLETGKTMGAGKNPVSGYQSTSAPVELCDADNNCIECFGARKWCSGEVAGVWNPEFGAYTRGGADSATYLSYQKGACFAWRLEKPNCPAGETAILQGGEWICATATGNTSGVDRASSIRRTSAMRRL